MTQQRPLVEKLLDVVLYAPAGLLSQVRNDMPKLVADGRSRLENRVRVAHWIGEMAVTTGRKEIEKRLAGPPPADEAPVPPAAAHPHPPFEGYDQQTAVQIVQLLGSLPHVELELIREYETQGRGRRTILNKIDQLLAG
jgi:hypothetical protein